MCSHHIVWWALQLSMSPCRLYCPTTLSHLPHCSCPHMIRCILLSHPPYVWCFCTMDMPPCFLELCVFWIWIRWWYCVFYVVDYIYHSPMCVGIILSDGLFNYHCSALSLLSDSSSSTFFMSTDVAVYSVVIYMIFHIVSITHCIIVNIHHRWCGVSCCQIYLISHCFYYSSHYCEYTLHRHINVTWIINIRGYYLLYWHVTYAGWHFAICLLYTSDAADE